MKEILKNYENVINILYIVFKGMVSTYGKLIAFEKKNMSVETDRNIVLIRKFIRLWIVIFIIFVPIKIEKDITLKNTIQYLLAVVAFYFTFILKILFIIESMQFLYLLCI